MGRKLTAGQQLRKRVEAELAAEAERVGHRLEFDAKELECLRLAVSAEDRREYLLGVLAEAQEAGDVPLLAVKISAEVRALDRQIVDLLGRISYQIGTGKSVRHQRAAAARWDRSG